MGKLKTLRHQVLATWDEEQESLLVNLLDLDFRLLVQLDDRCRRSHNCHLPLLLLLFPVVDLRGYTRPTLRLKLGLEPSGKTFVLVYLECIKVHHLVVLPLLNQSMTAQVHIRRSEALSSAWLLLKGLSADIREVPAGTRVSDLGQEATIEEVMVVNLELRPVLVSKVIVELLPHLLLSLTECWLLLEPACMLSRVL